MPDALGRRFGASRVPWKKNQMKKAFLLALFALPLLCGCFPPDLPLKPASYVRLDGRILIDGKTYPLGFSWKEENRAAWDEGRGWHTEWVSSDKSLVRIVGSEHAVVVWLPQAGADLHEFRPTVALVDLRNPQYLRQYPQLRPGEQRDGYFAIAELHIRRSPEPVANSGMTKAETVLREKLESRRYGYLYGKSFREQQWARSEDLAGSLSRLRGVVPLGKRGSNGEPVVWTAFSAFNSRAVVVEKIEPRLFGFELKDQAWVPLKYSGVYWYREGLTQEKGPIWVQIGPQRFDQQKNELVFDGRTQELIAIWRYGLESLL